MWASRNPAGQKMTVSGGMADIRVIVHFERNGHLAYDHHCSLIPEPLIRSQETALT